MNKGDKSEISSYLRMTIMDDIWMRYGNDLAFDMDFLNSEIQTSAESFIRHFSELNC